MNKFNLGLFTILVSVAACSDNTVPNSDEISAAINAGDYATAKILIRNAIEANPNDRLLAFLHGQVELELGNAESAKTIFTNLLNDKKYANESALYLAKAYLLTGKGGKALELARASNINSALAFAIRYSALLLTEEPEKAAAVLDDGLLQFPSSTDLIVLDGDRALAMGDFSKAKHIAQRLSQQKKFHTESTLFAGRIAMMDRRFGEANHFFDVVLQHSPRNQPALLSKVSIAYDKGDREQAKSLLNKALKALGESNIAVAYFRAQIAFDAGDFDKAHLLISSIRDTSAFPAVKMLSGLIAAQRGQNETAILQLTSFLNDGGEDGRARLALTSALISVNQKADAWLVLKPLADSANATPQVLSIMARLAAELRKQEGDSYKARFIVASKPDPLRNQMVAADKAMAGGDWKIADAIYSKLRSENPRSTNVILLNNSAIAKLELGSKTDAVEIARQALALAPHDPIVQDTLAWSIFKVSGPDAEVVSLMRRAIENMPGNPEIRQHAKIINNAMRENSTKRN